MAHAAAKAMTLEAFLVWEAQSPVRHEFSGGHLWAMGGASLGHGLIASALHLALGQHLKGSPCQVIASDLKVLVRATSSAYYPDLVVLCEGLESPEALFTERPRVLVEVFSPTTEALDRGKKFEDYALLPSLQAYVLVDPGRPSILVKRRARLEAQWRTEALGPEDMLRLPSIEFEHPVIDLYQR